MARLLLDGTPREIRFTLEALEAAEALMSRAVLEVLGQHNSLFKVSELVALLWGAWRGEEPKLTVVAVRSLVQGYLAQGGSLIPLHAAVTDALFEGGLLSSRPPAPGDADGRPRIAGASPAASAS